MESKQAEDHDGGVTLTVTTHPNSSTARGRGRRRGPRGRGGGRLVGKKEDRQRVFCQKQGHTEDICWKNQGKPEWATKKDEEPYASSSSNALAAKCIAPTTPARVTLSHEDFEHLLKMAHGDASLPYAALDNSDIIYTPPSSQGKWLIDSGATDHMTSLSSLFINYCPFRYPLFGRLADGSKVHAIGKGSVSINPNLCVHAVLLVPSFPMNLLSVKKFCTTGLCQVIFNFAYCALRDTRTKRMIGRGLSDGSLYYLQSLQHMSSTASLASSSTKAFEWHLQLGHPNLN